MPTNRNFGITFGVIFILVSIYCYYNNINYYLISSFSVIFFVLGFLNSVLLLPLNFLWFKFGLFLSKTISPIILFFLFYFIITPYGFCMRYFDKDIKSIKKKKFNSGSYWVSSKNENNNFDNQY